MRTVLITGASGDLAQAIIQALPDTDSILALGRSKETLDTIYAHRSNVTSFGVDITDHQAVVCLLEELTQNYGAIDVLINNAGYGTFKAFDDFNDQDISQLFEVNTLATIRLSRMIGQKMAEKGQGHIINIASMAGLIATSKSSIYSASKFAVIGFSNALRLELADKGVYVTTVNPGPIKTKFFQTADPDGSYLKRVEAYSLSPEQVAQKIVNNIGRNKRELNLPWLLALTHKFYNLFPVLSDYISRKNFNYK
ncbi:SDR family oxidoreductase [Streptococcus sp. sy004]|uniref:SDR family NAD(P)-dependent oxidoreductase n=1 Tax=Streptococcus sp. sy004 TaxID=2600149 RepID=UPI0011B6266F|nr:SDR family oxidoreductase [Streptococcus sp. sy004]TWT10397.1 SDR family oxidoreductase [Streptococcus sp. sy004]